MLCPYCGAVIDATHQPLRCPGCGKHFLRHGSRLIEGHLLANWDRRASSELGRWLLAGVS